MNTTPLLSVFALVGLTLSLALSAPAEDLPLSRASERRITLTEPSDALVSADGQTVFVFDADGVSGGDHSVVVYHQGKRTQSYSIEAFLTAEELRTIPGCRCFVGHRAWRHLFYAVVSGNSLKLVRLGGGATVTIDGPTGELSQYAPPNLDHLPGACRSMTLGQAPLQGRRAELLARAT